MRPGDEWLKMTEQRLALMILLLALGKPVAVGRGKAALCWTEEGEGSCMPRWADPRWQSAGCGAAPRTLKAALWCGFVRAERQQRPGTLDS